MSNAAVAAITFSVSSLDVMEMRDFLYMWMHGEFPEIRDAWPEAPEAIYIGADPLHPETKPDDEPVATLNRNDMTITTSAVTKLLISDLPDLDPISVFLEDFEPKRGKITISCYGKSWTAHWSSMWDGLTVGQFFTKLDAQYIIGCFDSNMRGTQFCANALGDLARRTVTEKRRENDLDSAMARDLYDSCSALEDAHTVEYLFAAHDDLMHSIFGDEWWSSIDEASAPNPDYEYLCRIIATVQQAITSQAGGSQ